MEETISFERVCAMLNGATAQIREHHTLLSKLDGAVGDGDHGTSILRAMEALSRALAANSNADLKALLETASWEVMGCDGGSTGPLLGSFFSGMSEAAPAARELSASALQTALASGIDTLHQQSRAQIGDKTMMDAFLPAAAALKAANLENGIKPALRLAAEAAAAGAESTKSMRARFGRARNLGDRAIGHPDPGAVSVSLIFKGFAEGI